METCKDSFKSDLFLRKGPNFCGALLQEKEREREKRNRTVLREEREKVRASERERERENGREKATIRVPEWRLRGVSA